MLDASYVRIIKAQIKEIREELDYHEEVIRDDIFKLLRKKGKIIFFPLDGELDLDGFHLDRIVNGKHTAFVYINTAKNFEKCIFCGAHELGHIFEIEKEIERAFPEVRLNNGAVDEIMNRFAAELLMPSSAFRKKLKEYLMSSNEKLKELTYGDMLKTIVALMDYFYVPYKAVVWRLQEINFLTERGREKFESMEKEDKDIINAYIYEGKYTRLRHPTYLKNFESLPEYLNRAEEEGWMNMQRIQDIRNEFGIDKVASSVKMVETEESTLDEATISKEFLDDSEECSGC